MESAMDKRIELIMTTPGVDGICVADASGLSLATRGTLKTETAPLASQLLNLAQQLDPQAGKPIVTLLSDHSKMTGTIAITIEFSGGSEFLVGNQKEHKVHVPLVKGKLTVTNLLEWIKIVLLKDCDRPELLLEGNTVRPGVLVLINECDWELMDKAETHLKNGDVITFISTLHGG